MERKDQKVGKAWNITKESTLKQEVIEKMRNIKTVKSDEPVEETLRKLRDERAEHLYPISKGENQF